MDVAPDLPAGTVSFLFSDVEGSTRLLERYGERLTDALTQHHRLLADVVARHDGVVFETVGDAVYAAFADPLGATLAGVDAQAAMLAASWGEPGPLRIRAALHCGPVERRGAHYVGPALFRAARILALGHGGQTLASAEVSDAVADRLPPAVHLRSLGHHRLKDLVEGEDVHQVERDDLPSTFPPLRSTETRLERLPRPISSFVDRPALLTAIQNAFELGARLVTLTGPGGTGKTRLAIEAAHTDASWSRDGAVFVDLAPIRDPAAVLPAIAAVIGVRPSGDETVAAALARWLADRAVLFVLDNLEQVLESAQEIADLLAATRELRVLVTSRERLRVRGERTIAIDPLPLVSDGSTDEPGLPPALVLFADRAGMDPAAWTPVERDTALRICTLLDGLPLAIELAAARVGSTPLAHLETQLATRMPLPGSGPRDLPERQRTLTAVVGWSRDLLNPRQRRLFDRLGVFRGSIPIEGAARLVDRDADDPTLLEDLSVLTERSLLQPPVTGPIGETRYGMLATTRAVAGSGLDRRSRPAAETRHARWMADVVELAEAGLIGPEDSSWIARLDLDWPDVEAAFEHAHAVGDSVTCHRISAGLWRYAFVRSTAMLTVVDWCRRALSMASAADRLRARVLLSLGASGVFVVPPEQTEPALQEAIDLLAPLGPSRDLAEAYQTLGAIALNHRMEGESFLQLAATTFEAIGDDRGLGACLTGIAIVRAHSSAPEGVAELTRRGVLHARAGGSPVSRRDALMNACAVMSDIGRANEARSYGLEAAEIRDLSSFQDPFTTAGYLEDLGKVLMQAGRMDAAAVALGCAYFTLSAAGIQTLGFSNDETRLLDILRSELGSSADVHLAEGRALDPEATYARTVQALREIGSS